MLRDRGLSYAEIADLTDLQIREIECHKRDKHGKIKTSDDDAPAPAATLESELAAAEQLAAVLAMTPMPGGPADPDERRRMIAEGLKANLREKYTRREASGGCPD